MFVRKHKRECITADWKGSLKLQIDLMRLWAKLLSNEPRRVTIKEVHVDMKYWLIDCIVFYAVSVKYSRVMKKANRRTTNCAKLSEKGFFSHDSKTIMGYDSHVYLWRPKGWIMVRCSDIMTKKAILQSDDMGLCNVKKDVKKTYHFMNNFLKQL